MIWKRINVYFETLDITMQQILEIFKWIFLKKKKKRVVFVWNYYIHTIKCIDLKQKRQKMLGIWGMNLREWRWRETLGYLARVGV